MVFEIADVLISWYENNKRDLPWRNTTDPYLIWVSEIILQQTRVAQGLEYFNRFVDRFPNVKSLAEAAEDEVLKYWQGLGYYSRARNLHAAAQQIVTEFDGVFPKNYKDVLSLKGVGEYTAAAICSFAWRLPYAVVDGNVFRVLARLFEIELPINSTNGKKYFTELAQELLDYHRPDIYNQAIMDFGALQCLPQSPDCSRCPLKYKCFAFKNKKVGMLPIKENKTVIKPRYFNYFHVHWGEYVLLSKRTGKDIWQGLYEYPLIETDVPTSLEELEKSDEYRALFNGIGCVEFIRWVEMPKHQLSHRTVYARFYEFKVSEFSEMMQQKYIQVPQVRIGEYAISRLMEQYLQNSIPPRLF